MVFEGGVGWWWGLGFFGGRVFGDGDGGTWGGG